MLCKTVLFVGTGDLILEGPLAVLFVGTGDLILEGPHGYEAFLSATVRQLLKVIKEAYSKIGANMIFENKLVRQLGFQMDLPLLQNNNIFTSWNFPNL